MSDWTSFNAIMQDLSVAQGCIVPASLETFGNNTPPISNIEETEEDYYISSENMDYTKPPDFGLIQEMLTIVKNKNETLNSDTALNSNLNPLSLEYIPSETHKGGMGKKKRKERNVAITSILQNIEMTAPVKHKDVINNPKRMFRAKCSPSVEKSVTVSSSPLPSPSESIKSIVQYTPSPEADVYCKKYMEKAKLKKITKGNIWERVEQELRRRDQLQRLRLSDRPGSSDQSSIEDIPENNNFGNVTSMDKVSLPHHRQLSVDDSEHCVVCNVTNKHGYCTDDADEY